MYFVFEVKNHFVNVVNRSNKTIYNIDFFSNRFSESSFSNGADGYNFIVGIVIYQKKT